MNPLKQAATTLPGHWYKGNYADGKGNYCMVGHLLLAFGYTQGCFESGESDRTATIAIEILTEVINQNYCAPHPLWVAEFNDEIAKHEDECVAMLEKAAAVWEEEYGNQE